MNLFNLIYLIILVQFLYPALIRYFGLPKLPSLFMEMFIFVLFTFVVIFKSSDRIFNNRLTRRYIVSFLILLFTIFISALINSGRWLLVFKSILEYDLFYVFLFFTIIIIDSSEKDQSRVIKLIYLLILFQVPVMIVQYTIEHTITADSISGTISMNATGGTGINAVLSTLILSLIISLIMVNGLKVKYLIILMCTFLPPLLGGARFGFILMPITIIVTIFTYLFINGKLKTHQTMYIGLLSIGIIMGIIVTFNYVAPQTKYANYLGNLNMITNPEMMIKYDKSGSNVHNGRLGVYSTIFNNSFHETYNVLFGLGTASLTRSSSLSVPNTKLSNMINMPDSAKILSTLGLFGIMIICAIFIMTIFAIKKYLEVESAIFLRISAFAFLPFTIVLLISLVYTSIWASQAAMIFWVILGIFMKRYIVLSRNKELLKSLYTNIVNTSNEYSYSSTK